MKFICHFYNSWQLFFIFVLFQLSVFFDVLLPMTTAVSEMDFIRGDRSGTYGKQGDERGASFCASMSSARRLLWKELHGYRLKACKIIYFIISKSCNILKLRYLHA